MEIDPNIISQIQSQLQSSPEVIIISHRNPDPDTIGSNLALKIYLQSIGKKNKICLHRSNSPDLPFYEGI